MTRTVSRHTALSGPPRPISPIAEGDRATLGGHVPTASLPALPDSVDPRVLVRRSRIWFESDHSGTLTAQPSPERRDIRAGRRIDRATQRGRREARGDRV